MNNAIDANGVRAPSFNFVAVITKATNAITLRANPVRYQENWKGTGTCKTRTDGKLPKVLR